jgi:hypothetical protein
MSIYSTLRTSAADTTRVECKEFAFHHAGYTSESHNTVMFRLRGSRAYEGGLRMATVLMLLSNVVESSTLPKLRFSHMRGQDLEEFRRDGYFIDNTDYYVHCARPDDPSDVLYDFPAIPCFEVWSHDLATPPYWNEDGGSSLSTDHYTLRTIDRTPHELAKRSDRAVTECDENCVMSDRPVWITKRAFLIP